ncbi:MAG: transglutaminase domain-containing protein [Candidatus Limnocylindria bacterium]
MTDWARVVRAGFRVRQHYRYTYTAAVWDLRQRLVMVPPDRLGDQRLLAFDLAIRGGEGDRVRWERDAFGNRVARVTAARVERAIDFEATFRVERVAGEHGVRTADAKPFLDATALTAPDDRLREAASNLRLLTEDPRERVEQAMRWTADALEYRFGITGYQTPAAMALHLGKGVCQDYAHIMLAVLRLMGLPARYVSGHLIGEGAPHAWVEAFVERQRGRGVQILAYDPTHRRRAGLGYIPVAVGRDFADVSPTSGVFSGPATGQLSASKHAEVLEVAYREADGAVA